MSKLLKEEFCTLRGRERNRKALLRGLFSNNRGNSTLGNKRYINDQIMLQKKSTEGREVSLKKIVRDHPYHFPDSKVHGGTYANKMVHFWTIFLPSTEHNI
jgi:phosphatidylinositol kinase/protein kinase (PI-3  family)